MQGLEGGYGQVRESKLSIYQSSVHLEYPESQHRGILKPREAA